jgi:hypothetical protein
MLPDWRACIAGLGLHPEPVNLHDDAVNAEATEHAEHSEPGRNPA